MSEIIRINHIVLTQEDTRIFGAFKRNHEKFIILLNSGLFDLDSGKVEVNVNNGQIQNVHVHKMTYSRNWTPPAELMHSGSEQRVVV